MDKKEIYEHLAKIYLDASTNSKRKKQPKTYSRIFKNLFFISVFVVAGLSGALLYSSRGKSLKSEIALVLVPEAAKINFHFDPAKKETFTINLNNLDLNRFKSLAFTVKKSDYKDNISLRVEFFNIYNEKSEVYFKDIGHKWQDHRIRLSQFRGISDWSRMRDLIFTVEEWNAREKKGIVYVDNVRLFR